eukprot:gb/GEZN01007434.1/.p1 GENE.gb/GEZN01007434.1/~~gb/GEZN01007434.1/.p1  ORF type:complete len:457 (-),score=62.31 gb/GEZN01007434.1/:167-1390(-)
MGLFVNGLVMGHYAMFTLDVTTQQLAQYAFKAFASFAEISLYVYMGVTAISSFVKKPENGLIPWSFPLIVLTILFCLLGRAVHVPINAWIANYRRTNKITLKMQFVMWWGGLRGAIAFALAQHVGTPNGAFVATTTIVVVVFTTVVFGSTADCLMNLLGMNAEHAPTDQHQEISDASEVPALAEEGKESFQKALMHDDTDKLNPELLSVRSSSFDDSATLTTVPSEKKDNEHEKKGNEHDADQQLKQREKVKYAGLGKDFIELEKLSYFTGQRGISVVADLKEINKELAAFEATRTKYGPGRGLLTRFDQDFMQYIFGGPRNWLLGIAGRESERGPQDRTLPTSSRYGPPPLVPPNHINSEEQEEEDEEAEDRMAGGHVQLEAWDDAESNANAASTTAVHSANAGSV